MQDRYWSAAMERWPQGGHFAYRNPKLNFWHVISGHVISPAWPQTLGVAPSSAKCGQKKEKYYAKTNLFPNLCDKVKKEFFLKKRKKKAKLSSKSNPVYLFIYFWVFGPYSLVLREPMLLKAELRGSCSVKQESNQDQLHASQALLPLYCLSDPNSKSGISFSEGWQRNQ